MIVLALDTCLSACSAAVLDGERVLARRVEPMARGHQERLAPLVQEVMAEAGMAFGRLDRIGVTVGPGSFTGLRVGLAFAKGLGAALGVPVVAVGVLEALAAGHPGGGVTAVALDAKRGQVWVQAFSDGAPLMAPDALEAPAAVARLAELTASAPLTIVGAATDVTAAFPGAEVVTADHPDPADVARIAAVRDPVPPRPLYLRAPDAKLPGGRELTA